MAKFLVLAEEGGAGKVLLLNRGAYEEMDICLMSAFVSLGLCTRFYYTLAGAIPPRDLTSL
jgi:hypothetical protein